MSRLTTRIVEALRAVSGRERPFTSAVILAAGSGSRMGESPVTKQLLPLCGIPVAIRTLLEFDKSEYIDEIILVLREEERSLFEELAVEFKIKKIKAYAIGGQTRQESALSGFEKISPNSQFVAIHDAARCLITEKIIASVLSAAYACGGAAAGHKVTDSAKLADGGGIISETVEREQLWLVQTPQAFKSDLYRAAAYTAKEDGFLGTDDCALVERLGAMIKIVDCGRQSVENIKITKAQDIDFASFILQNREETDTNNEQE